MRQVRPSFRVRSLTPHAILVAILGGFIALASGYLSRPVDPVGGEALNVGVYNDISVAHVYDGDTIRLVNGEKVRFVGVDTPESSSNKKLYRDAARSGEDVQTILNMGHKAAEYTQSLLSGRRVRLEFDIEKRDKYGRLLAYVYRADDGLFVNEELVRQGYAYPMTIPPNVRHADEFKALFREAKKEKRGLWKHTTE